MRRRGFFPKGQGAVSLTVTPLRPGATLPPITLERRRRKGGRSTEEKISVEVSAFSAGAAVPEAAARAAADACAAALLESGAVASREQVSVAVSRLRSPEEAFGDGGGVIAVAKVEEGGGGEGDEQGGRSGPALLLFGSALPLSPPPRGSSNKKQKTSSSAAAAAAGPSSSSYSPAPSSPAEVGARVGADLARDLLCSSSVSSSGDSGGGNTGGGTDIIAAATDRWLQDQLIVFMALARGTSRVATCAPLTEHTRSAIAVAEALTSARFRVVRAESAGGGGGDGGGEGKGRGRGGGACVIECEGAGVVAR